MYFFDGRIFEVAPRGSQTDRQIHSGCSFKAVIRKYFSVSLRRIEKQSRRVSSILIITFRSKMIKVNRKY